MAKRRTALNSALKSAATGRPEPLEEEAPPAARPAEPARRPATLRPEGKAIEVLKPLTTRVNQGVLQQLKVLSAEQDRPIMYMVGEALNLLFEKYGKPPIAVEQPPGRGN